MIKKKQYNFLIVTTLISLVLLPFAIVKRSFKDWVIVYLVSILGNYFADKYLVKKGYLTYKIRPFPKNASIHLPFDFVQYPLLLLYYNQWTLNSKPIGYILKLLPILIPQTLIEWIAAKKTDLITWKRGWNWYHSFISLFIKMILCRMIIAIVRIINNKKMSTT